MSITYNQQGKITLEPTKGNILGITEIVLQHFEKTLLTLEATEPDGDPAALRVRARDMVESHIEDITATVVNSCRNAMMTRPEDALRKDLIGRILFHKIEHMITDDLGAEAGFSRLFIGPVLQTVRTIIGENHYNNLNEHSVRPSLEYCVVHELGESKICWNAFYSQNLISILLIRLKNLIKRWLAEDLSRKQVFIDTVNANLMGTGLKFTESAYRVLMHCWDIPEKETEDA